MYAAMQTTTNTRQPAQPPIVPKNARDVGLSPDRWRTWAGRRFVPSLPRRRAIAPDTTADGPRLFKGYSEEGS